MFDVSDAFCVANKKLLEAFEIWMWRRMLRISWTEKVTNEEVLIHASEARSILKMIGTRCTDGLGMFSGMRTFSVIL